LTSELKIKANRANSRASTGPRSPHGRTRAARNALRHGLSLPVCSDPVLSEEVEALAREIAGTEANAEIRKSARLVAEAHVDLHRVRRARHQVLTTALSDPSYDTRANTRMKFRLLCSLVKPNAPEIDIAALSEIVTSTPQGDEKLAIILTQEAKRLQALDRYESRAQSRRNRAVQQFDWAVARNIIYNI
jgi:hypothetical protein